MKKIFKYFFIFYLLTVNLLATENKIIVKIENQIITSYQIKNKIRTLLVLSNQEINQTNVNNTKNQAITSLINLKLKKHEINKYKVVANPASIKMKLLSLSSNNIAGLKEKFRLNNLDYELFIDEIKIEMAWQKLVFTLYNEKVKVNESEIQALIENLQKLEGEITEYKISEIEVNVNNEREEKEKIKLITQEIVNIGFENAALKYSVASSSINKGDIGWINSKSLSEKIFKILNKMSVGDISEPIIGPGSVTFLKIADRKVSKAKEDNNKTLKENLVVQKKNELYNLYSRSYLSKLKNISFIEYK